MEATLLTITRKPRRGRILGIDTTPHLRMAVHLNKAIHRHHHKAHIQVKALTHRLKEPILHHNKVLILHRRLHTQVRSHTLLLLHRALIRVPSRVHTLLLQLSKVPIIRAVAVNEVLTRVVVAIHSIPKAVLTLHPVLVTLLLLLSHHPINSNQAVIRNPPV